MASVNELRERDVAAMLKSVLEYLEVDRRVMQAKLYAETHPLLTLFWLVTLAMCCIPIICFCTFVCASVFLTVAGFILIEGTVVTIATVLLGGALLMVGLMALGFSTSMVIGYYAISCSLDMIQKVADKMQRRKEMRTSSSEKQQEATQPHYQ